MQTVVIDLGAGNTKLIASVNGRIVKQLVFPSAVSHESTGALSSFLDAKQANHELRPVINGTPFRVSVRANQQVPDYSRPTPTDNFQATPIHDALIAAALHETGLERVDLLVLGTPVQTYKKHSEQLQQRWVGVFDFGLGRKIDVRGLLVVPQPYGTLLCAREEGVIERQEHINYCILDAGFYSVDVLTSKGLNMDESRSFGMGFGTAAIYQKIADMIAADLGLPVGDLDRIEFALRTGKPFAVYNRSFNLKHDGYLQKVQPHIEALVTEIYGRLGGTEDIDSALLTGGGAALFQDAIRKVFRHTRVMMMPNPIEANARGYLIAGHAAL